MCKDKERGEQMKELFLVLSAVEFHRISMETLEAMGIKEEYVAECQKAVKEIAETDEELAKAVALDLEGETEVYIKSRAHIAVRDDMPERFIMSAFEWADTEKGFEYWAEMTHKFCDSHPMIGPEED